MRDKGAGRKERRGASDRPARWLGLQAAQSLGRSDERAKRGELSLDQFVGPGLHEHVADRGRLDWPGDHRQSAGIGGELAQQRVLTPSAHDVYDRDVSSGEPGCLGHGLCECRRKAVENAADDGRPSGRLTSVQPSGRGDPGGHVAGREVHRIVGVDPGSARREIDHEFPDLPDPAAFAGHGYSEEVLRALAELTPEHRAVVVMRYVLDYTPGEIARALALPRGTVNSRLRRALDVLDRRLGEAELR